MPVAETEAKQSIKRTVPKRPPGVLCGVEHYKSGRVKCTDDEKKAIRDLVEKIKGRDSAARREQVILVWKKRLFDRGLQHLLPMRNGGWQFPILGSGYHPEDDYAKSVFTANIYTPFRQMITSVLTRKVPTCRTEPMDPFDDVDITTAEGAEKLEVRIDRDNHLKTKLEEMGRFLYTDGLSVFFSTYQLDGQRFGYAPSEDLEELEEETVPEDESEIADQEEAEGDDNDVSEAEGSESDRGSNEGGENSDESDENSDEEGSDEPPAPLGRPLGHEVLEIGGALEWKFPIKAKSLGDCTYARRDIEIPIPLAKAKYPLIADKLRPSQGGPGGDDIDRLARVNVNLGVLDNFNTSDSQIFDVTESKNFLRPCELIELPNDEMREAILNKFPRGMYVTFCGETFAEAYNASMDDHLALVFCDAGDGVHRPGLGDWLVPVQEVLNNWLELADDYFIRGVPNTWMDNEMFNVQKLKEQTNTPGGIHPFVREPGVQMAEVIWQENAIQFPPELKSFIDDFKGQLAQILTGALPALTGEGDTLATDTFGGMLVQRDAALGRMGLPWRQITEAIPIVKRQLIRLLAQNHEGVVTVVGSEAVQVELEDLRGNFRVFADVDENIPASFTEKANALAKVFTDAVTNPNLGEMLFNPDNLEVFRDYGMPDLQFPPIWARDKQLGEIVMLLKSGPIPNPQIMQVEEQLAELQLQIQELTAPAEVPPDPTQIAAQLTQLQAQEKQLQAQLQSLPPEVSSVQVRHFDDDASELYVCTKFLNSARGRELANGDEEEQEAYRNIELHAMEHETAAGQKQAANQKPAKPPSTSIAIKDLPANEAAALAKQANLPGDPKDFAEQDAADAAAKHPGPGGIQVQ